jgi:hypothetical protein
MVAVAIERLNIAWQIRWKRGLLRWVDIELHNQLTHERVRNIVHNLASGINQNIGIAICDLVVQVVHDPIVSLETVSSNTRSGDIVIRNRISISPDSGILHENNLYYSVLVLLLTRICSPVAELHKVNLGANPIPNLYSDIEIASEIACLIESIIVERHV